LDITISRRNLDLSASLEATVRRKLARLDRLNGGFDRAEVHFFEERNPRIADREICEVFLDGGGQHLQCKVAAADPVAALDKAVAKLEQQLARRVSRSHTRAYVAV
jgi:ribosomal subunit interface protein